MRKTNDRSYLRNLNVLCERSYMSYYRPGRIGFNNHSVRAFGSWFVKSSPTDYVALKLQKRWITTKSCHVENNERIALKAIARMIYESKFEITDHKDSSDAEQPIQNFIYREA